MKDYYKILNLNRNASKLNIKKAYKKLATYWHPDKNKSPNAVNMFKNISEAYQVLSDPNKKYQYDSLLNSNNQNNHHNNYYHGYDFIDPFIIFDQVVSHIINDIVHDIQLFNDIPIIQEVDIVILNPNDNLGYHHNQYHNRKTIHHQQLTLPYNNNNNPNNYNMNMEPINNIDNRQPLTLPYHYESDNRNITEIINGKTWNKSIDNGVICNKMSNKDIKQLVMND
jgi:curved DNA-binding protein CbpA